MADTERSDAKRIAQEKRWETAVKVGGGFTIACGLLGIAWVGWPQPLSEQLAAPMTLIQKMDVFWRAMAVLGALLTFVTIVWRGLIASRQADQQRDQLKAISEQIRLTDENNLAQLLQTGAEMVADSTDTPRVSAGIATLQAVATADNKLYALPAMDVLADLVQRVSADGHWFFPASAAVDALNDAHRRTGLISQRTITCEAKGMLAPNAVWKPLPGVLSVGYVGGKTSIYHFKDDSFRDSDSFHSALISFVTISEFGLGIYFNCTFRHCRILNATGADLEKNTFEDCDFSDAQFELAKETQINGTGNYYAAGHPPSINWALVAGHENNILSQFVIRSPG